MNKIGTLFVMALLVVSMVSFVAAEDEVVFEPLYEEGGEAEGINYTIVDPEIEEAGVIPGNFFYGFDRAMDNLRARLTFSQEKKTERLLTIAEERLAEAETLAEKGKFEKAEKARAQYEKYLERTEKTIEKMEANGDVNKSEEAVRSIARIQNKFEEQKEKIAILENRFLEKHGENMTEDQLIEFNELMESVKMRSGKLEDKVLDKRSKIETKYKVLAELSDEELEEHLEEIESEEGLKEAREMREERSEHRFARAVDVREGNLERLRDRLAVGNLTDNQTAMLEAKILKETEKLDDFRIHKSELQTKIDQKIKELQNSSDEDMEELRKELEEIREELRGNAIERREKVEERREDFREKLKEKNGSLENESENESEENLE